MSRRDVRSRARRYMRTVVSGLAAVMTIVTGTFAGTATAADDCKRGRWASFNNPSFRNQGQCVAYVVARR